MLTYAITLSDLHEVLGQIVRIAVAGIGTALGRAPPGNTGRANVPLLETMKISQDVEEILERLQMDGENKWIK